jgi:hypothetical protein
MAVAIMAGLAHDRDDLIDRRRVRRVALPLLRGATPARNPGMVAGERRRPAASTNDCTEHTAPSCESWTITRPALQPAHCRSPEKEQ